MLYKWMHSHFCFYVFIPMNFMLFMCGDECIHRWINSDMNICYTNEWMHSHFCFYVFIPMNFLCIWMWLNPYGQKLVKNKWSKLCICWHILPNLHFYIRICIICIKIDNYDLDWNNSFRNLFMNSFWWKYIHLKI